MEAVLLNSGGIGSRVAAALAQRRGYRLHSLYIACEGDVVNRTWPAADRTASMYCIDHYNLRWPSGAAGSLQPVPFKQLLVHILGAQYAAGLGAGVVVSGQRLEAVPVDFPDMLREMLHSDGYGDGLDFNLPLWETGSLKQVVYQARQQGVNLNDTYSCSQVPHCGACAKCQQRKANHLLPVGSIGYQAYAATGSSVSSLIGGLRVAGELRRQSPHPSKWEQKNA